MITVYNSVTKLRELFAVWGNDPSIATRPIVCTPHLANHGMVSSWLISPSGSPPRGNIFVDDYRAIHLAPEPKVLSGAELEIVRTFSERLMKDRHLVEGPIIFD